MSQHKDGSGSQQYRYEKCCEAQYQANSVHVVPPKEEERSVPEFLRGLTFAGNMTGKWMV